MDFPLQRLKPEVEALKVQANAAFKEKAFSKAVRLYAQAIKLQPTSEVLYSNSSGAKLAKDDVKGALSDAQKAVEVAPTWFRAHSRLAAALAASGRVGGAIRSMRTSLTLHHDAENEARLENYIERLLTPRYAARPVRSLADQMDLETMTSDVAKAVAQGRELSITGSMTTLALKLAIERHGETYPAWACIRRALYLPSPESVNNEPELVETNPTPGQHMSPEQVLGCEKFDSFTLYNEDAAERMRGNPNGVGIGYLYRVWEVIVEDKAESEQTPNPDAAQLLHIPNLRGPLMIMKTLQLKVKDDPITIITPETRSDIIAWEAVTLAELRSEAWQEKRAEFVELIRNSQDRLIAEIMGSSVNNLVV